MKSIKKEDRDESVEESSVRNNNTQQQIQPRSIPIRRKSRKKFEESKRVHAISIRIPRSEILPQNLLLQKMSIVD